MKNITILFAIILLIASCQTDQNIELIVFNPISNIQEQDGAVHLTADLSNALTEGIKYPTINQTENGKFEVKFQLKNNSDSAQELFYKIYYQNESYKFPDESDKSIFNFYGSWQDTEIGFKPIPKIKPNSKSESITDYIQIVGNPRNEKRYFGTKKISAEKLQRKINEIKNNPKWFELIKDKATQQKITIEKSLIDNASYVLRKEKNDNLRWQRNPRAGEYSFLFVVMNQDQLNKLPEWIKHIDKTNEKGLFENPYSYFLNSKNNSFELAKIADKKLKTSMVFLPETGIVAHEGKIASDACNCGNDDYLENHAHFEEFYNVINWNKSHYNIPIIADIDDSYTRDLFKSNSFKYPKDSAVDYYKPGQKYRIKDMSYISDSTCSAVKYDSASKSIWVINKGNNGKSHPRKQSAGVMTRYGFMYGKVTGKIKFPELINKHNVWNGVTNAFWVIKQSGSSWNNRSECKNKGYVAKKNGKLGYEPFTSYSEIDFEIIKTSRYAYSKEIKEKHPNYKAQLTDNIIVACTNHDIGCQDPVNYFDSEIIYGDTTFTTYRWYPEYRSKFIRTPINEDKMFKTDYYYYQIGWYPDSIVWKIGPTMDKLYTVGYMDKTITKIPDNQMVAVMSQEFHHGDWWPPVAFHQDNIPYPKNDIIGKLYEIRVE